MEYRTFPTIGQPISLLGFGLMRLPINASQPKRIDFALAQKMVDQAIAGGVNYFDTAYVYHDGQSEPFAGKALAGHPRSSFNIATKMPTWQLGSIEEADRIFDDQLSMLKVDHFDFYLVHNLYAENYEILRKLGLYDNLRRKKEQGLIKRLGFSIHDGPEALTRVVDSHEWDFAQIQLNYIDWEALKAAELYQILTSRGLPVIIMEPVRGGALAGLPPKAEAILKGRNPAASSASWALRFAASLPGVMTVLSGMSAPAQMADNLATFNNFKPLADSERELMKEVVNEFRLANAVPCTGCRYCMDCPSGVEIPLNFAVYNLYRALAAEDETVASMVFANNYRSVPASERAEQCVACGECETHCPQRLPIPSLMSDIAQLASKPQA
jgi:predicted aldo/keto reductase-like oxidoreductase